MKSEVKGTATSKRLGNTGIWVQCSTHYTRGFKINCFHAKKKLICGKENVEQSRKRWQDSEENYILRSVIICTYCQIIVWQPNDGQWDRTRMWHTRKRIKKDIGTLVRKPSGKRQGRKPAFRNPCIKLNVLETELTFYACQYTCSPHCCVLRASDKPQLQVELCNAC